MIKHIYMVNLCMWDDVRDIDESCINNEVIKWIQDIHLLSNSDSLEMNYNSHEIREMSK